jgi:Tol biopolymer transport system component
VAILLPVLLALAVVVVVGRPDGPAEVPADYRPAGALPRAAMPLPVDHMLFASDRRGTYDIYSMRNDGQLVQPLTEDPQYDSWGVRLSPDRFTALFYRTPAGEKSRDAGAAGLWAVASDGSSTPVLLRPAGLDGWVVQSHAEWDQYGSSLIMSGGGRDNPQIYRTNAVGQHPQLVTGQPGVNRPGANTDPSFAPPDGRQILFIGCPGENCEPQDRELYQMAAGGSDPVRLTNDRRRDREPYVSADGNRVAWLSFAGAEPGDGWQLKLADRDGDTIHSPRSLLAAAGEDVVGRPQWSLNGSVIYVHRKATGRATTGIWAISVNSTAPPVELTLGQPGNHEDPSV